MRKPAFGNVEQQIVNLVLHPEFHVSHEITISLCMAFCAVKTKILVIDNNILGGMEDLLAFLKYEPKRSRLSPVIPPAPETTSGAKVRGNAVAFGFITFRLSQTKYRMKKQMSNSVVNNN